MKKKYTHFGKVIFQFESSSQYISDSEVESLTADLEKVLEKHQAIYKGYDIYGLPQNHFPIQECYNCKHLTYDLGKCPDGIDEENNFPELERMVRPGRFMDHKYVCNRCNNT